MKKNTPFQGSSSRPEKRNNLGHLHYFKVNNRKETQRE